MNHLRKTPTMKNHIQSHFVSENSGIVQSGTADWETCRDGALQQKGPWAYVFKIALVRFNLFLIIEVTIF